MFSLPTVHQLGADAATLPRGYRPSIDPCFGDLAAPVTDPAKIDGWWLCVF
jgi:hypothetical protein